MCVSSAVFAAGCSSRGNEEETDKEGEEETHSNIEPAIMIISTQLQHYQAYD